MLEAALTLPVICMLIFFAIELIRMHIVQAALNAICAEATFSTICGKANTEFDAIVAKYRPKFVAQNCIQYDFSVYENLEKMCAASPYGGASVAWSAQNAVTSTYQCGPCGTPEFIRVGTETSIIAPVGCNNWWTMATGYFKTMWTTLNPLRPLPSGTAFVLTFICKYPFSSAFVKQLFGGGVNTIISGSGARGSSYFLWARGVGVIN
jgi:hypothetical protein